MKVKLLGIKAITSLHIGAGQGLGHIDLPVAREKSTNYPYLPGTALKGVIRDKCERRMRSSNSFSAIEALKGVIRDKCERENPKGSMFDVAFGKETDGADKTSAGSLIFSDARLLALPIRSFFGTFAAVSCPMIIGRLLADLKAFKVQVDAWELPKLEDAQIVVRNGSPLVKNKEKRVYLEDVDFTASTDVCFDDFSNYLEKRFSIIRGTELAKRFALVSDDAFAFLCETGTEVNAHIRIDAERGTVRDGALWYQETLPPETFMYSFVYCDKVYGQSFNEQNLLDSFCISDYLQFGGKASTGLGRCQCKFEEA